MNAERLGLLILRAAGAVALAAYIAMFAIGPRAAVRANVPGFSNPVVGFELASEPEQVFDLLGAPGDPERPDAVRRMDLANRIDFAFLAAYPDIYLGAGIVLLARGRVGWRTMALLAGLALFMFVADLLENRELLILSRLTEPPAMEAPLDRLRIFTLVKWQALFLASAVAAVAVWRDRSWWRWTAVGFAGAALIGLGSLFHLPAIEWTSPPLAAAWLGTWVHALATRPGGR